MRGRIAVGAPLAVALLVGSALAAGTVKSGPQVGSSDITPFHPLNITGKMAGKKFCQV
jgi:hypothetical protein